VTDSVPWYKAPQWWALIIAGLSFLYSIYNRYYPIKPNIKVRSILPVLIYDNGTGRPVGFSAILDVLNDTDTTITLNEMMINGETEQKENMLVVGNKKPTLQVRIVGNAKENSLVNKFSSSVIRFDFIEFDASPAATTLDAYIGTSENESTWKMVTSKPSINYLININQGKIIGISDDFASNKLSFNIVVGEKLIPIKYSSIMDLIAITPEEWNNKSTLERVYKESKERYIRKKELGKVNAP
jgi:hypothetical protein